MVKKGGLKVIFSTFESIFLKNMQRDLAKYCKYLRKKDFILLVEDILISLEMSLYK